MDNSPDMVCMFQGQQGGVTHILFSPDGTKLYSGGRKVFNDTLNTFCYDYVSSDKVFNDTLNTFCYDYVSSDIR